jgi:hypothetical protein
VTYEKISILIRDLRELINDETDGPKSLGLKDSSELREYLRPYLEDACLGLKKLMDTYEEDVTFVS